MAKKHNKVFTYSGIFGISAVYLILLIALIVSFIFARFDTTLFVVILCILTVIFISIALIVYLTSRHIARVDDQTKANLEQGKYKTPKRGNF